jgi:glycosyltransferase involved in cell wall biosynthesis
MLKLAGALVDRGCNVDLVLCSTTGALRRFVPDRVRVVDLGSRRVLRSVLPLARYLRRERPAAMISALDHPNLAAVWAHRLARHDCPLVLSTQNVISAQLRSRSRLERLLLPRLMRWSFPRASYVTGVARAVADDLIATFGLPPDRVVAVPNPIVTTELIELARRPLEHSWFIPGSAPVILGVGRLEAQKRFDLLIEAFALLRKERPARLLILGEGSERSRLAARAAGLGLTADDFDLPGFVDNPYAYMARSSLFVLSSDYEGLPTVLVEALAVGCPVLSTDCPGGSREILDQGVFGPLVPCGDPRALHAAMKSVLDAPTSGERLRERANEYTASTSAERYLQLIGASAEPQARGGEWR